MRRSQLSASRDSRRGAAAVEFAILLPFLAFAFVAATDFCRIFYFSLTISNCARNGALYGSADQAHALNTTGIQAAAAADADNLDRQLLSTSSCTDSATSPTYVEVTVTYPFSTITRYPGFSGLTNLSRTVRMSVVPATPSFH